MKSIPVIDGSPYFESLYQSYGSDLAAIIGQQRTLYSRLVGWPMFDDVEGEILYLALRKLRPNVCLEVSCGTGWSSSWILHALVDNGCGTLHSNDTDNIAFTKNLTSDLKQHWQFYYGSSQELVDAMPHHADFYLQDSGHELPYAKWLMDKMFPRVRPDGLIGVHDVFALPAPGHGEAVETFRYLKAHKLSCFTPSSSFPQTWERIQVARRLAGIDVNRPIHHGTANPLLLFRPEAAQ